MDLYEYIHTNSKDLISSLLESDKKNKGYVCPVPGCANGTGRDGDGIIEDPNNKGYYHCFKCGFHGDLVDIVGQKYGIENDKEKLNKTCELFNINNTYEMIQPKVKKELPQDRIDKIVKALEGETQDYRKIIELAQSQLHNFNSLEYIIGKRNISLPTAEYFGLGYLENHKVGNREFPSCILFPSTLSSYAVRDTSPDVSDSLKSRKPSGSIDIPLGLYQVISDKEKIMKEYNLPEPVFLVEGLFDAPSIYEAGGDAIALNGTGGINTVIEIFKRYQINRPVILALDNDEAGKKAQKNHYKALTEAGIECYYSDFYSSNPEFKDANEFLIKDKRGLEEEIAKARKLPIQGFEKSLNKNKKEEFKNKVQEGLFGPAIRTDFKSLDHDKILGGGIYPGLYIIGAISSLGKTAFCLQLADQIASQKHDVIYFSLELSTDEIFARSTSRYSVKDLEFLDNGALNSGLGLTIKDLLDPSRLKEGSQTRYNHAFDSIDRYFKDTGDYLRILEAAGTIDADSVRQIAEEHIKITGRKPLIFIDYLQLLIPPKDELGKRHYMSEKQTVDANIFRLKQLTRDLNIPIIAISSFNRENYENPVSMVSFKQSGGIEYSCDVLIGLERVGDKSDKSAVDRMQKEEEKTGIRKLRVKILKNRNDQTGGSFLTDYYCRFNYFRDKGIEKTENVNKNFRKFK